jgi:hypothetical protein
LLVGQAVWRFQKATNAAETINGLYKTVNQRLAFSMNNVFSSAKTCCNTLLHENLSVLAVR